MVAAHLRATLGVEVELKKVVTTGDRRMEWSLEKQGGKGLFTKELEDSLRRSEADVAVHSAKDLPGEMPAGLALAGYLPRADPRDVLVLRAGVGSPRSIATDSPRRRIQLAAQFPAATFGAIRGNVDTRLRKVADGLADATVLAAAGLARLGIRSWPGLEFRPLGFDRMVPAVGQAAIAVQCREADVARLAGVFDGPTARAVAIERALQLALGGGCQTAFGAHVDGDILHFYHETSGRRVAALTLEDFARPAEAAARILHEVGFLRAPIR